MSKISTQREDVEALLLQWADLTGGAIARWAGQVDATLRVLLAERDALLEKADDALRRRDEKARGMADIAAERDAARTALAEWREEPPGGIVKAGVLYLSPERVADEVEAARREGAEAMREAAAQDTDCGCAARGDVLARLAEAGHKRASYLCPNGDVCCALQASAIRALPLPGDTP